MRRKGRRPSGGGAHSFRDKFSDWPFVLGLGLYDARACPDCGGTVCYTENRTKHREHHISYRDIDQRLAELERSQHILNDTVRAIAHHVGLPIHSAESDDAEDWHNDHLTRSARETAQSTVYLDDERGADAG